MDVSGDGGSGGASSSSSAPGGASRAAASIFGRLRDSVGASALGAGSGSDSAPAGAGVDASPAASSGAEAARKVASWADKARKAVAHSARDLYAAVPQDLGGGGAGSGDLERGGAGDGAGGGGSSGASKWLQNVRQQATAAAEQANKNLAQAAEKAKAVDLGQHANKLQHQVSQGFSRVSDGVQEKGKLLTAASKDLSEKANSRAQEARQAAATKAREVGAKAGTVAGAAKGKLSQAGQSLSGFSALTMSPAKLAKAGGAFFFGTLMITLSFSFLPLLPVAPQKFALCFTFGSMSLMGSFALLAGPAAFAKQLAEREKLPFSSAYAVGLVGTLVATILLRNYLLTAVFSVLQFFSLLYFLASYVPGGQAVLNFCGRGARKAASYLLCRKS